MDRASLGEVTLYYSARPPPKIKPELVVREVLVQV